MSWKFVRSEKFLIFLLLALAVITRFWNFGSPKELVFDEVYFSRFPACYFSGQYYFDIHPPLAKLILAGSASIFDYPPPVNFDFSAIGNKFPEQNGGFFYFLRFVVSVFGVLLPLAVYFLSKQLFSSKSAAFFSGLLIVFDNAFLVQSRYILVDTFLLLFGVLGLIFFAMSRKAGEKKSKIWFLVLSGLFLAASFSVKWTGLIFAGVVGLVLIYDFLKDKNILGFLKSLTIMFFVGLFFYLIVFAIHFAALPFSGTGDAFMSKGFRASLIGANNIDQSVEPRGFLEKFVELNITMYSANAGLKASHSYSSKWYSWPIMQKPIYYWNGEVMNNQGSKIYFLGNPLVWWLSFLVMIYWFVWWLIGLIKKIFKNKELDRYFWLIGLLLVGYIGNLLAYIMVSRIAFLYHYLPSLIFAFLAFGIFIKKYFCRWPALVVFFFIVIVALFIFFAPLSYGLPLSEQGFQIRQWLPSWQ